MRLALGAGWSRLGRSAGLSKRMSLLHRLRNWRNPDNLTAIHLAHLTRRYGFEIGAHSYGRPKVRFPESGRQLTIGRYCSIADKVEILLGGNHRVDFVSTYPFGAFPQRWPEAIALGRSFEASRGDVRIGHDVWLGSGATILSGCSIGHGAVIAAHAVVTRDVAPYAIAAGNPARQIRLRFAEPIVGALLRARWWDLSDLEVAELVPLLASDRLEELIAAAEARHARPRAASPSAAEPASRSATRTGPRRQG
jgi:acetyltransferase-like isoleucine patch superfamily enzyme